MKCVFSSGRSFICFRISANWLNGCPSAVGNVANAAPYDPGPKSPGSSPRFWHFASVAQYFHHLQPNSSSPACVRTPFANANSSPTAAGQKLRRLRSVKKGTPFSRILNRITGAPIRSIVLTSLPSASTIGDGPFRPSFNTVRIRFLYCSSGVRSSYGLYSPNILLPPFYLYLTEFA